MGIGEAFEFEKTGRIEPEPKGSLPDPGTPWVHGELSFDDEYAEIIRAGGTGSVGEVVYTITPSALSQCNYSVRHRVNPFVRGHYEGRLNYANEQYIVSGATMEEVLQAMLIKAEEFMAAERKLNQE